VKALDRGLAICTVLAEASELGCSFSDIKDHLATTPATASRLLKGLMDAGWASKGADGRYRPGPGLVRAIGASRQQALTAAADPLLKALSRRSGHSTMLVLWTGSQMLCALRHSAEDSIPFQTPGHLAANLVDTPWGWFFAPDRDWAGETGNGQPVDPAAIASELAILPERGWTCHRSPSRIRLAAPIRAGGRIIAAAALGGPSEQLSSPEQRRWGPELVAAADGISTLVAPAQEERP
jgi:DNA-binding IclR family transcriptional regulator